MLLRLSSPCYILGDLHGNFKDLQLFSKSFWNMGIDMSPANFVFLGDYVDRGPHSLETATYLFCLKVLHPDRVFLLRGNHEFESSNGDSYYRPCFLDNCEALLGKKIGKTIWKQFNEAFEWMPIAATIDDRIFCCHGGIPRLIYQPSSLCFKKAKESLSKNLSDSPPSSSSSSSSLSATEYFANGTLLHQISQLPRPLTCDQVEKDLEADRRQMCMDLLWADPATKEEEDEMIDPGWFGPNSRGDSVVVFGNNAVEEFIRLTG